MVELLGQLPHRLGPRRLRQAREFLKRGLEVPGRLRGIDTHENAALLRTRRVKRSVVWHSNHSLQSLLDTRFDEKADNAVYKFILPHLARIEPVDALVGVKPRILTLGITA